MGNFNIADLQRARHAIQQLEAVRTRMEFALTFYANRANWPSDEAEWPAALRDRGDIARRALKEDRTNG